MPAEALPDELMKALMSPENYAEWQRQQAASREFWRTLNGPAQRPLGSNADEWHLFLDEHKDTLPYLAVQIAEAIEEAEARGRLPAGEGRELCECAACGRNHWRLANKPKND